MFLCLTNKELRHEGVWGSRCTDPHFLDFSISLRWVVSFTPWWKSPWYPLDRRLGGPQSQSCMTKRNSWPYWTSNSDPSVVQPIASCYTDHINPLTYISVIMTVNQPIQALLNSRFPPILSHPDYKFHYLYLPEQNTAIYESLTLLMGCSSFRQYLPLRASKFGINLSYFLNLHLRTKKFNLYISNITLHSSYS
jgi:hypothetical protein